MAEISSTKHVFELSIFTLLMSKIMQTLQKQLVVKTLAKYRKKKTKKQIALIKSVQIITIHFNLDTEFSEILFVALL